MLGEDYPPRPLNYSDPTWPAIRQGFIALAACGLPWVILFVLGKAIWSLSLGS